MDRIIPPFRAGNPDGPLNVGPAVVWPRGLDCRGWRLPTEAEWEYAARAGTRTAYHTGTHRAEGCDAYGGRCRAPDPALDRAGWYSCNSGGRLHPVAGKRPNAWGLFDVHGNVGEWVWDWMRGDLPAERSADPTGAAGDGEGFITRVVRGGDRWDSARECRSADRPAVLPTFGLGGLGMRPVRTVGD